MPTFRNDTESAINYELDGKIYNFPAKQDVETSIWLPYQDIGLKLIDEKYPPVQSKILAGGKFKFRAGMERKLQIPHSRRYTLKVQILSGGLTIYAGSSTVGEELTTDSEILFDWAYAPYVRFVGLEAGTEARIYAEACER